MAPVTLGRAVHLLVASLAGFVTKGFVNSELGRSAFVAFGAVTVKPFLMLFVLKDDGPFFVLEGHDISGGCNCDDCKNQDQGDD